jgi:FkbM family methyltransferase
MSISTVLLPNSFIIAGNFMKILELIKLRYRAYKYKTRNDRGEIAYIESVLKPGQTVLDIGAHKAGYLYIMLQKVGASGKIYAFEPQSRLHSYITGLKQMFGWDNVTVEHLALSDAPGKVTLFIPAAKGKFTSPGATIAPKEQGEYGIKEDVATEKLDDYCARNNIVPDLLKIDVEGNELRVFKGGAHILATCKPSIIFECEARHVGREQVLETFNYLRLLGYEGYFIRGEQKVSLTHFNFDEHQVEGRKPYCNNFIFEKTQMIA